MNTRILLVSSAAVMAVAGIVLQFAPHEILNRSGVEATGVVPIFLQMAGALYLGFAALNYMARGVTVGGIYARPLALGNFAHFLIGALALAKYAFAGGNPLFVWTLAALYAIFAALFAKVMFTHPLKPKDA